MLLSSTFSWEDREEAEPDSSLREAGIRKEATTTISVTAYFSLTLGMKISP